MFCKCSIMIGKLFQTCLKQWNSLIHKCFAKRILGKSLIGKNLLRNSNENKGLAFTEKERELYMLQGLLPVAVRTQELQIQAVMINLEAINDNLYRYMCMRELQNTNKRLFYSALQKHTKELMPIVYTPTVGLACQQYSLIFHRYRGLFITIKDAGNISRILDNSWRKEVKAIVVTDGERILGLGDLGANGMGIPVGKMALYSAVGGIPPDFTLPITLDVGTNNQRLLLDPFYIGLRQNRVTGEQYDKFVDEFMVAVTEKWGRHCLIQFEDFGNKNALRFLRKYQTQYCMFNDDIQGTATIVVAGLLAAFRKTKTRIQDHKILFFGAGTASIGSAELLVMAMNQLEGIDAKTARNNIWLMDVDGLITQKRMKNLNAEQKLFAKKANNTKDLLEIINIVRPTCLIGASTCPGAFNRKILRRMAEINVNPIIFALSNPTSKSECTADQAYEYTDGRCVFASGSPYDDVTYHGKKFRPGQGNNVYVFPAIALAVMACRVHTIPNELFLVAAKSLAEQVTESDLDAGSVYPPLEQIHDVSLQLATKLAEWLFANGCAKHSPEPENKFDFLKSLLYDPMYDSPNSDQNKLLRIKAWHKFRH